MGSIFGQRILGGGELAVCTFLIMVGYRHWQRISCKVVQRVCVLWNKESICVDQDKSEEKRKPRYLKCSTCSRGMPFSCSWGGWIGFIFLVISMVLHLTGLSDRWLEITHSLTLGAHAPEGYGSCPVCVSLSVRNLNLGTGASRGLNEGTSE